MRVRVFALFSVGLALASGPAAAGPQHVLRARLLAPAAEGATYAVDDRLKPDVRDALAKGLADAGLTVAAPGQPHAYVVTVQAKVGRICTTACSAAVQHDDAVLDDYYRRAAVVVARTDPRSGGAETVAWYAVLQSDGLSAREGDYLPSLVRYGAKAYGRTVADEAPPRLPPTLRPLPDVIRSPG